MKMGKPQEWNKLKQSKILELSQECNHLILAKVRQRGLSFLFSKYAIWK